MIDVVYDACVSLRDLLMNMAAEDVVRAHWTDEIQEEWIRNLLRNRPDLKRESLERTRRAMDETIECGLVCGYEALIETLQLPDPDDRHVLAAAIHVRAKWIITFNLNDFPAENLVSYGVEAVSPDDFICRAKSIDLQGVLQAAQKHRLKLKRPSKNVDEYLQTLRRQKLIETVIFLGNHRDEI